MNPAERYVLIYDEEFDCWDVYLRNGVDFVDGAGGFATEAEARHWVDQQRNANG